MNSSQLLKLYYVLIIQLVIISICIGVGFHSILYGIISVFVSIIPLTIFVIASGLKIFKNLENVVK
jgi:hypothetical protein